MSAIALDLGSTHMKGAVIAQDGSFADEPLVRRMPAPMPGQADEHVSDAEDILQTASELVRELVAHHLKPDRLFLSGQTGGFVLTSRHFSGANFVSWQDARAERRFVGTGADNEDPLSTALGENWRHTAGVDMKPGLPLANLWYKSQANGPSSAQYHTLGSFLTNRWCGVHATDATQAAATGLFDIRGHRWNPLAIEVAGHRLTMPRVVNHSDPIGVARVANRSLRVYADVGDHHAAVLGGIASADLPADADAVVMTIGTAGLVARVARRPTDLTDREVRPFFQLGWLEVLSRLPGGRELAVLSRSVADQIELLTGTQADEAQVWQATNSLADHSSIGDFLADSYVDAIKQLCGSELPKHVVHTGGVLARSPWLGARVDLRLGVGSHAAPDEATLSGLAVLALRDRSGT